MPRPGVDAYEIFRKIDQGEIKGLLSLCFNPVVSLPDNNFIRAQLEKLEFYVAIDFFLNETARYADIVLPGSLHEEDEGTVTTAEGRVIKINKAVDCPGDARQDWRIIQDIAQALGIEKGLSFSGPEAMFNELRHASKGGVADYSGITYEKLEAQNGVFWPCPDDDHTGTPRLFEPGSWNPVAQGHGPFYFPDGKARFNVAPYTPPTEDVDDDYPLILTTGRVGQPISLWRTDAAHCPLGRQLPGTAHRDAPVAGRANGHSRWRLGNGRNAPRRYHVTGDGGQNHPPRHDFYPLPLAGTQIGQPTDDFGARPYLQDTRV